jgi:hypothetical protein
VPNNSFTRLVPHLADQMFGHRPDTGVVLAIQRWTGFPGGREAFAIAINGAVTLQRTNTSWHTTDDFRRAAAELAPWRVSEQEARDALEQMGRPRQQQCGDCATTLPIGGLYCVICGLNQTMPAGRQRPRLVQAAKPSTPVVLHFPAR